MQALWMLLGAAFFATMGVCVKFGSAYFNASPFGYRALAITVNSGGILRTSASHALGGDNVDAGTSFGQIVANGGTIQFDGSQYVSAGTVSGQGRIVLTGGTITGSGDMRMLGSTISTAASATTSTISGSGGINLGFGGVTFDVAEGAAAVDLQVSAVISSTNGVIKSGAGLAAFSGTNTYTGATTVSQGTLLINGSTAAGSTVGVAAGATLGGTGTIGGAVNVTGVLSPGASIETLGTGTLSFANGSTLVHELDSSVSPTVGSDLVKVTGNLNLAGTVGISLSDLAVTDVAFNINDVFSLINYTGTWNGGLFTLGGNELADDEVFIFGLNNWKISYDDLAGGLNYSGEHASGSSFVNLTVVPDGYRACPAIPITSSFTVPLPSIVKVNGYCLFSKTPVTLLSASIVMEVGLLVPDILPCHCLKRYSPTGVATNDTLDPFS
jgi:autotransporter-associated beta strand protein